MEELFLLTGSAIGLKRSRNQKFTSQNVKNLCPDLDNPVWTTILIRIAYFISLISYIDMFNSEIPSGLNQNWAITCQGDTLLIIP